MNRKRATKHKKSMNQKQSRQHRVPRENVYPEQSKLPDGGNDKRGPMDEVNEGGITKGEDE